MKCGGIGDTQNATDEIQAFCEQLKNDVLKQSKKEEFEMYKALAFASQVVAGTNYFVKIQIANEGNCVHVKLFKPLPHAGEKVELSGIQLDKQVDDEITYL